MQPILITQPNQQLFSGGFPDQILVCGNTSLI
jgi:hypothetical protein